jgi:hypothetical protein
MEPIIVVGCQRSGSTLLGSVLGAHSKIVAIPEAQFFVDCMPSNTDIEHDIKELYSNIAEHYRFKIWKFKIPNPICPKSSFQHAYTHLISEYNHSTHGKLEAKYWVDHQPGHIKHLNKIKNAFPKVRVVNIIRDGRAVANSILPLDWGPNSINRAAYFWEKRVGYGLAAHNIMGKQMITIKYEDLTQNPKTEIEKLCLFLDLDFEPEMMKGNGLRVPEFTDKQHHLVGKGMNTSRVDKWKTELGSRNIEIFESLTDDFLTYLGYPLEHKRPIKPKINEAIALDLKHIYLSLVNKIKFRLRVKKFT